MSDGNSYGPFTMPAGPQGLPGSTGPAGNDGAPGEVTTQQLTTFTTFHVAIGGTANDLYHVSRGGQHRPVHRHLLRPADAGRDASLRSVVGEFTRGAGAMILF